MNKTSFVKALIISAPCLFSGSFVSAQDYESIPDFRQFSIGASVGMADLWGDIGTTHFYDHWGSPHHWNNAKLMGNLHVKYSLFPFLAVRLGGGYGSFYASDQLNKKLYEKNPDPSELHTQLYFRNQSVKTNITEANLVLEINPFRALNPSYKAAHWKLQPTLLFGLGYYHFDPYGTYAEPDGTERSVRLQPMRTEGQGMSGPGMAGNSGEAYKLSQFNMPIGGGLRWQVSEQWAVSLEYLYRYCFTDYLDDVSNHYMDPSVFDRHMAPADATVAKQLHNKTPLIQPNYGHPEGDIRGTPKEKDGYSSFGFSVFYTFKGSDYDYYFYRTGDRRRW